MTEQHQERDLWGYLGILRRRRWIILQACLLVPLAAVLFSLRQEHLYQASAEVLLSRANLAASLTGTPDPSASQDAERTAQTQAELARIPLVAKRTLKAADITDRTPGAFLAASGVSPKPTSDLLEFRVTDASPALAVRLATEYGRQFTLYRRELDTASVARALDEVEARLDELKASGDPNSTLYETLVDKEQQLRTLEALQTSNAFLVRPATGAVQVQPRPVRNGIIGFALGLLLGIGLAFLREALDTRVRSAEAIGEALDLPLLARLPEPPRRLRNENRLVMLTEPNGVQAEGFRMLRTNLEFVNLERRARAIMVTSAVEAEGKSTTVANLAVALARIGHQVVLVDLDLRRPILDRFFGLEKGRPGLTNVALGHVELEEAVARVAVAKLNRNERISSNGDGTKLPGVLEVLPPGPLPPGANIGEFVGSRVLGDIIRRLRERSDFVFIDAPPLLRVGDAMGLSAQVDGLILMTRLNVVRRPMLKELRRLLDASRAPGLGFVLTGAEQDPEYGYGRYGYAAYAEKPPRKQKRRERRRAQEPVTL